MAGCVRFVGISFVSLGIALLMCGFVVIFVEDISKDFWAPVLFLLVIPLIVLARGIAIVRQVEDRDPAYRTDHVTEQTDDESTTVQTRFAFFDLKDRLTLYVLLSYI